LSKAIFDNLGGTLAKFTWVGGEDKSSLVLGSGRPFFVRLQNPLKRKFKFPTALKLDSIIIHNLKIISHPPKKPFSFISFIEILVITKKEILLSSLKKLQNLTASPIVVYENSGKRSEKQIFKVDFEKKSKHQFKLIIQVEGGFPVKRFVTQENIEPGLSQILGTSCKCEGFDILDVKMTTNN
jgi:tRNA pseudouridine synthase 10